MTITPPLGAFDRDLTRSLGKAYRQAYLTCQTGKPHADGMNAAREAFVQRFPFPNPEMARETTRIILAAIEAKHPGWLSNNGPKRFPSSNEDAANEAADLARKWF